MDHDWNELMWQQSGKLGELIDGIADEDFDQASLCEGWRVRDVMGHMLVGHTTPFSKLLPKLVSYKFNVEKGSFEMSKAYAEALSPDEIRSQWHDVVEHRTKHGIAKVIPSREGFLDHFVHEQDIRRPLGLDAPTDPERLLPALDASVKVKSSMFAPAKRVKAVRLEATDLDWSHGEGPAIQGPAEALVMAAAGRPAALADLQGDGLAQLAG